MCSFYVWLSLRVRGRSVLVWPILVRIFFCEPCMHKTRCSAPTRAHPLRQPDTDIHRNRHRNRHRHGRGQTDRKKPGRRRRDRETERHMSVFATILIVFAFSSRIWPTKCSTTPSFHRLCSPFTLVWPSSPNHLSASPVLQFHLTETCHLSRGALPNAANPVWVLDFSFPPNSAVIASFKEKPRLDRARLLSSFTDVIISFISLTLHVIVILSTTILVKNCHQCEKVFGDDALVKTNPRTQEHTHSEPTSQNYRCDASPYVKHNVPKT